MLRVIITIALLLSSIAIFFFLSLPHYEALQLKMAELETEKEEFRIREDYINKITDVYEIIRENEEEIDKLSNALPDGHYIPSLFLAIKDMERYSGVAVERFGSFSTRDSRDLQGLKETDFTIEVSGTYFNLRHFIYHLENNMERSGYSIENLSRIIEVENMTINYFEDRRRPLTFNLSVKTYSY